MHAHDTIVCTSVVGEKGREEKEGTYDIITVQTVTKDD